jgi:hypothetical protein
VVIADACGGAVCLQRSSVAADKQLGEAGKNSWGFRRNLDERNQSAGPGCHRDVVGVGLFFGREAIERLAHVKGADGDTVWHGVERSV